MTQRTYRIHLQGQVQGVGFRPFVWRLAQEMGLHGWVNNAADGVHVEFNASPHEAQVFFEKMQAEAPPLARIRRSEMVEAPPRFFEKFVIVESSASSEPDLPLTPDFALCEACTADLQQPGNRRHRYAFTTCTTCGPRYSIIHRLPYDRAETAMQPFAMCPDCQREYDDVTDRRYFSQTNSCPACGVKMVLVASQAVTVPSQAVTSSQATTPSQSQAVTSSHRLTTATDDTPSQAMASSQSQAVTSSHRLTTAADDTPSQAETSSQSQAVTSSHRLTTADDDTPSQAETSSQSQAVTSSHRLTTADDDTPSQAETSSQSQAVTSSHRLTTADDTTPSQTVTSSQSQAVTSSRRLTDTVEALRQGSIVAAKGIGGYLLLCDASNRTALKALRQRKHRPSKPFALLYPSLEVLAKDAELTEAAMQELTSPVAPIVLLPLGEKPASGVAFDLVAPDLDKVGAMLPYSPLLRLLADDFGGVLVATSGNLSGSPIVFEDKMALEQLTAVADYLLTNNREIVTPQDDSVLTFSQFHQQKIILRRSRGLAPSLFVEGLDLPSSNVLAMGASLKSTFCRRHRRNVYVSQYLGDLESYDTQQSFRHALDHLTAVLQTPPDTVLLDAHPDYFSTQLGEELAASWGAKTARIQHHEAHFAAVLAENDLLRSPDPVLGVIWDGTGLGTDGHIWGGEFFLKAKSGGDLKSSPDLSLKRVAHLDNFDFLLGDKMPREPRISALSLCKSIAEAESFLVTKFTPNEWFLYNRLLRNGSNLQTSSMGRFFDGVASLLGLGDVQTFEGEAAMRLEQAATRFFKKYGLCSAESWLEQLDNQGNMPFSVLLTGLMNGLKKGDSIEKLAAQFHVSLVNGIRLVAQHCNAQKLAFSGGVWQNGLLVDLCIELLGGDFELFFHRQISPNDECVSFGQLIHHFEINK